MLRISYLVSINKKCFFFLLNHHFRFAESHNFTELTKSSVEFIGNHFPQISEEDELYDLPKDQIIKFLSSENLVVDSESQVFQTAIRWITQDITDRRRYVFVMLKYVRLSLLPLSCIEKAITECTDNSLKVALKSVHNDLLMKKGCLVPLNVSPRLRAKKYIYVIGGAKRELTLHKGDCNYSCVERFDTFKKEWSRGQDLKINRIVPGVTTLNGKIYVIGGEQESNSLVCGECYDPLNNQWSFISNMIVPRCEFGLCSLNGYLYAMGGWVGDDIDGTIERYDSNLDKWMLVGSLPEPRFSMGVVSYNGKL